MDRRRFIGACAVAGASTALTASAMTASNKKREAGLPKETYLLIEAVQKHMFPGGNVIPAAGEFHATEFLSQTVMHPTFDKDIRKFVIEGAEELQSREKQKFLSYGERQKEKALRAYEDTDYGSGWLDRIMLLSLEGLLSDPIYSGNFRESGWKSLATRGGDPRPTVRYAGL